MHLKFITCGSGCVFPMVHCNIQNICGPEHTSLISCLYFIWQLNTCHQTSYVTPMSGGEVFIGYQESFLLEKWRLGCFGEVNYQAISLLLVLSKRRKASFLFQQLARASYFLGCFVGEELSTSVCVMDDSASYFIRNVINFSEILVVRDDLVKRNTDLPCFVIMVIVRVAQAI